MSAAPTVRLPIVTFGAFPPASQPLIEAEFDAVDVERLGDDPARASRTLAILTRSNYRVPVELLERLPALKAIATSGVGFDGIPLEAARVRGIAVTNTPGLLDSTVAELAVGLLLALLRELPAADRHVREGRWATADYPLTTGLAGKRIGIVGLGRIGRGIARRLQAFEVEIAYSGRAKPELPWRHLPSALALAGQVDVLVVCCSGGPQTRHLVDAAVIAALGPGGFLVNVSRGSVVDEAALTEALASGRLRGAALDVFADEPLEQHSRLAQLPNTLLSPHAGSATHETRAAMLRLALDNLHAVLRGDPPLTPVP